MKKTEDRDRNVKSGEKKNSETTGLMQSN